MTALCERCTERPAEHRSMCHRCYQFTRRRQVAYGRWESTLTDAEPARQHVLAMRAAGIGYRRLGELSGVPRNVIGELVAGRQGRGQPPRTHITRSNADALLAVPIPDEPVTVAADSALVCGVGASRRVQALIAHGYPLAELAAHLGVGRSCATRLARGDRRLKASTVRAAREVFDRLQLTPGPSDNARRYARARGWPLPFDWDEDSIDDPAATANRSTTQPGVHRATQVAQINERRAQVARLTGLDWTAGQIAERLGVDTRTVERDRALIPDAEAC